MVKLTSVQLENRNKCVTFANEYINPDAKSRDSKSEFVKTIWQKCADLNLHGIFISEKYNGQNLSLQDGMSLYESLGYAFRDNGLSFGLAAQHLSCSMTIEKFASNEMHFDLLRDIVNGKSIVAHAITERSSGSIVFDMKSEYILQDGGNTISLKGTKTYSSNLPVSDFVLCYANQKTSEDKGDSCSAFLIPTEKLNEIKVIEKMGLNTCIMGEANFDLEIDKAFMLNSEGEGSSMFQEAIAYERIGIAALHLGTVERILEEAIIWVKSRKSGDSNLTQYQSITHPLVNIHNDWLVLRNYLYSSTANDLKFSKLYFNASILKDKVSELYVDACQKILQIYGGLGYTKSIEIERMMRDAMASKIYSGTSEIQKEIVWRFIN